MSTHTWWSGRNVAQRQFLTSKHVGSGNKQEIMDCFAPSYVYSWSCLPSYIHGGACLTQIGYFIYPKLTPCHIATQTFLCYFFWYRLTHKSKVVVFFYYTKFCRISFKFVMMIRASLKNFSLLLIDLFLYHNAKYSSIF